MAKSSKVVIGTYVKVNTPEFRKQVQRRVDAINKRIARMGEVASSAKDYILSNYGNDKGRVSIKGLKGKAFEQAAREIEGFFTRETSSISGIKKKLDSDTRAIKIRPKSQSLKERQFEVAQYFRLYNEVKRVLEHRFNTPYMSTEHGKEIQDILSKYVQGAEVDLTDIESNIEQIADMVAQIADAEQGRAYRGTGNGGSDIWI